MRIKFRNKKFNHTVGTGKPQFATIELICLGKFQSPSPIVFRFAIDSLTPTYNLTNSICLKTSTNFAEFESTMSVINGWAKLTKNGNENTRVALGKGV